MLETFGETINKCFHPDFNIYLIVYSSKLLFMYVDLYLRSIQQQSLRIIFELIEYKPRQI